jgi:hypothetical protein
MCNEDCIADQAGVHELVCYDCMEKCIKNCPKCGEERCTFCLNPGSVMCVQCEDKIEKESQGSESHSPAFNLTPTVSAAGLNESHDDTSHAVSAPRNTNKPKVTKSSSSHTSKASKQRLAATGKKIRKSSDK